MSDNEKLAAGLTADLRKLIALIETHPELAPHLRNAFSEMSAYVWDPEVLATYARATAAVGAEVVKDYPGEDDTPGRHFRLYANFEHVSLRLHCPQSVVCERVVVGTETVTKTVQDPVALAAVPEVEVTEEVEVVEWQCKPLLAAGSES